MMTPSIVSAVTRLIPGNTHTFACDDNFHRLYFVEFQVVALRPWRHLRHGTVSTLTGPILLLKNWTKWSFAWDTNLDWLFPFCHNPRVWQTDGRTDGQTDDQTDRQIEFSSLDCVCIPCSAVIISSKSVQLRNRFFRSRRVCLFRIFSGVHFFPSKSWRTF